MQKGERVGAIVSYNDGELVMFGYGTFEGEVVPDIDDGFLGEMKKHNVKNPRILLDSGERVYGAECWWGPEEDVKKYEEKAKSKKIITVKEFRS